MNRRQRRLDVRLDRKVRQLPTRKPEAAFADLSTEAKGVLTIMFLTMVPRPTTLDEATHINVCIELSDGGFLWFEQHPTEAWTFRRRIAAGPPGPWTNIEGAFQEREH